MSKLRKWMMKEEQQQRDCTTSSGSGDSASSSAIKLFGKTIAVSGDATKAVSEEGDGASTQLEVSETGGSNAGMSENLAMGEVERKEKVVGVVEEVSDVVGEKKGVVEMVSNPVEKKLMQQQQQRGLTVEERKEQCLKKPDKLIPCPRCESVDTKFCYYNNYNINQPRHFCKSCQRYWTAGGTLRNVLVGAGRRKNKYGVAHQQHHAKQDGENSSPAAAAVVRMDPHEPAQRSTPTIMPPSIMNAYGAVPTPMKHAPAPTATPSCDSSVVSAPPCFPVFSAFKPTGAETSSDSITKLRQRTRPDPTSGESSISSPSTPTDTTTYVLTPRAPQTDAAAALWTRPGTTTPAAAAPPLGFFNGAWPYGYNIGWSGAPSQHPVVAAAAAAPPMWTGMWTSQVPAFGWNMLQGGWSLPWRPVPVVGVQMQQPTPPSRKRDSPTAPPEETKAKTPRVSEEVEA